MTETYYSIKGPGLIRAAQEAVSANKDINIVFVSDNTGHLLRVGYHFKEKGKQAVSRPTITWFSSDEIHITSVNTPVIDFEGAFLDIEFSHPKDNERHFLLSIPLDKETRLILRNLFRIDKKSVTGFVVQMEIRCTEEGKEIWKPVVRYDHAHGFIHRDLIASDGSKTKCKLATQNTKDAIVLAVEEIRENLNLWLRQLGYKILDEDVLDQPVLNKEIDRAKSKLLELHDNPEKIKTMRSTFGQLKEHPDYEEIIPPPP